MEAEAFEHEQSVAFYTKAKQILDEWVRYETNERERQQKLIADAVIAQVHLDSWSMLISRSQVQSKILLSNKNTWNNAFKIFKALFHVKEQKI